MLHENRTHFWLMTAAVLLLVASVGWLFPARAADEFAYLSTARSIHEGTSGGDDFARFPGYSLLLAGVFFIYQSVEMAIAINVLLLLGIAWLTRKLAKKMGAQEDIAFFATLTSPFLVFFATRVLSEIFFAFVLVATVGLLVEKKYFWAGLASGFLFTIRYTGGLIGFAMLANWYFHDDRDWRKLLEYGLGLIVGLLPLMVINHTFTGNPLGLVLEFFGGTYQFGPNVFSLPDRIPSYILASPLLLGGLLIAILFRWPKMKGNAMITMLAVFLVGLELYSLFGLVNIPQFRFLVPLVPLALVSFLSQIDLRSAKQEHIVYALLVLNVVGGIGGAVAFNTLYEKNVMHEKAAEFVQTSCNGVYSNLTTLTRWTNGRNTPLDEKPQCILDTKYEKGEVVVPTGYTPWMTFGKVTVYQLTQ